AQQPVAVLAERRVARLAVDLRGGREDHALVVAVGELEDVLRAVDVDVEDVERVLDVMLDPDHRRQVVHEVGLGHQALQQVGVEHRSLEVAEACLAEVVPHLEVGGDVERHDLVAGGEQPISQVRTQETAAPRNQNSHGVTSPRESRQEKGSAGGGTPATPAAASTSNQSSPVAIHTRPGARRTLPGAGRAAAGSAAVAVTAAVAASAATGAAGCPW